MLLLGSLAPPAACGCGPPEEAAPSTAAAADADLWCWLGRLLRRALPWLPLCCCRCCCCCCCSATPSELLLPRLLDLVLATVLTRWVLLRLLSLTSHDSMVASLSQLLLPPSVLSVDTSQQHHCPQPLHMGHITSVSERCGLARRTKA
jgi:hypothetical protein